MLHLFCVPTFLQCFLRPYGRRDGLGLWPLPQEHVGLPHRLQCMRWVMALERPLAVRIPTDGRYDVFLERDEEARIVSFGTVHVFSESSTDHGVCAKSTGRRTSRNQNCSLCRRGTHLHRKKILSEPECSWRRTTDIVMDSGDVVPRTVPWTIFSLHDGVSGLISKSI